MSRSSPIEAALRRHRLADVARRTGITLAADTGTVTVRCPLPSHGHPDRTPSLRLYLDDDRYYCFGCNARGDIIQWAQDAADISVTDALRLLDSHQPIPNAWAGAALQPPSTQVSPAGSGPDPTRTPPERVHAALDAAWRHYADASGHRAGSAYLARRGIDIAALEAITRRPEVGHTSTSPTALTAVLRKEGFTAEELVDAGLTRPSTRTGGLIDVYRRRVLVPLRSPDGQICALIGRDIAGLGAPKYLNPPHTAVYHKAVNLYRPLPTTSHPEGVVVIVEGTLDAIAVAAAAVRAGRADRYHPLTQSGRELSDQQLDLALRLYERAPIVAFDGDEAGREASTRLARRAVDRGADLRIAGLPPGEDPASLLAARGPAGLRLVESTVRRTTSPAPTSPVPSLSL